ncbi:hypothetical protein [Sphingopyxis sp.]|uniref:hypothetical protein n=1 Tax=Sphingopyxis sp. TaxID=1908224 RepID=UPI0010F9D0CC|nr:hypothetical protein [Sphingopyxis sp.]MBR2171141.1 hypothetical protein [Sphingopyxis sp.]
MNNSAKIDAAARERHQTLDLIGLRAHATAVGLIQLCEELLNAGVLSAAGLDRIKDAICSELTVAKRARVSRQWDFDDTLRQRIDAVFPAASGEPARESVGPIEDFEDALTGYHGA